MLCRSFSHLHSVHFWLLFKDSSVGKQQAEKISPLGLNFGAMNVECGQYVQHCLKVLMWDGTIIRDCDPLALCPHDGSKVIKNADYFCCVGNVCNGKVNGRMKRLQILLIIFIGQILHILISKSID
uniref:Uncharacterized protein n=1 Tax=Globodera rostochiensis TaxID=31243 RepID=A0A914IDC6_GLORO